MASTAAGNPGQLRVAGLETWIIMTSTEAEKLLALLKGSDPIETKPNIVYLLNQMIAKSQCNTGFYIYAPVKMQEPSS